MKKYLNNYICEEQTGFLPGCHLKNNIRMVINVIEFDEKYTEKEIGLVFQDAEKAFDNLEWNFMTKLLETMEVGERFANAIKVIYKEQQSFLIINDEPSKNFKIRKGTRQECPLSPLLFFCSRSFTKKILERIRASPA